MLFLENTPYQVPDNPFRGPLPKMRNKDHKEGLQEALMGIRAPFLFSAEKPLEFNGACVGIDMSTETFNAAVTTVITAIERGYYSTRDPTPLGTNEWARLSCSMLAAVGRGYYRQYSTEKESILDKVRAEAIDPNPLPKNPTLFHRLAAIADDIGTHIGVDQEGYQDWYLTLKNKFNTKATKATAAEVDEKWLQWKANHLDRLAERNKHEIAAQARDKGIDYFIETGQRLGLHITRGTATPSSIPTPKIGRKRTASGSLPRQGSETPMMRKAIPLEHCAASPTTPRGRTISPCTPIRMQTDSSSPQKTVPPPELKAKGALDLDTIMAVIKAVVGPEIQSAMAPYANKIAALEEASMHTSEGNKDPHHSAKEPPAPKGVEASIWAPMNPTQHTNTEGNNFTPVTCNEQGKKAKNKANCHGSTGPWVRVSEFQGSFPKESE